MQNNWRGAGGGGGGPRTPIESPDSLRSVALIRILDLWCEGEIYGFANKENPLTCMYLNETPVQNADTSFNFQNVQIESRVGTQFQDYVPGFEGVESENRVGLELRDSVSWTQAVTNLDVDAIRVRVSTPALSKTNTSNGDIGGYSIALVVELQTDGGPYVQVMNDTITGKASTKYERSYRIDLPRATSGWVIRVRRLTPNANSAAIQDMLYMESYTEIVDAKFRMPMSAYSAVTVSAEQFPNIPTRAARVKGLLIQVPSNYNPDTREYTGVWDGTFQTRYSNNPAWCYYDMAVKRRYGLGKYIKPQNINKWELYRIGQYCDQLVPDGFGGWEPRFTCNVFFQQQGDAFQVMNDLASVFRAIQYATGDSITPVCDMPEDPVYTYNQSNVLEGKFIYSSTRRKDRHNAVLVSWNDMTDFCRAKIEYVPNPEAINKNGLLPTSVIAVGCTSRGQAFRLGRYIIATENYEKDLVEFGVGMDGTIVAPGKIIRIDDPLRQGKRRGGRIVVADLTHIAVDFMSLEVARGDRLYVTLPDASIESRIVDTVDGSNITVSEPFSATPVPQSIWSIEPAGDATAPMYRVLGVRRDDAGIGFTVSACRHVPSKFAYADAGIPMDPKPVPVMPGPQVPTPTGLNITQRDVADQNTATKAVTLSWDVVDVATYYIASWRMNDGQWVDLGQPTGTSVDIVGIVPGMFEAQVVAVNSLGNKSQPALGGPWDVFPVAQPPGFVEQLQTGQDVIKEIALANEATIAQEIIDRATEDARVAADAAQKLANEKAFLLGQIDAIGGVVNDLIQADEWDANKEYPAGEMVQHDGKLYRALSDLPAGNDITNTAQWQYLGEYASVGEALAATIARTDDLEQRVTTNEGDIEAGSTRVNALETVIQDPTTGLATKASIGQLQETNTKLDGVDGRVTANTNDITSNTSAIADKANQSALDATNTQVTAQGNTIASQGNAITQLQSDMGDKASSTAVTALTNRMTSAEGEIDNNTNALTQVSNRINDPVNGLSALSTATSNLNTRTTAVEGSIATQATQIGQVKSMIPSGSGNLAPNPGFDVDLRYWVRGWDQNNEGGVWTRDSFAVPTGMHSVSVQRAGIPTGWLYLESTQIAVQTGVKLIFSAWMLSHRGKAGISIIPIQWDGATLPEVAAITETHSPADVSVLSQWKRQFVTYTVPGNVRWVKLVFRQQGSVGIGSDPYSAMARPMLEVASADQTSPSGWSPSPVGVDEKYASVTTSLQTQVTTAQNGVNSYYASWTMTTDVNGYVSGMKSVNNGTKATIDFVADKVRFIAPAGGARTEYSGGNWRVYDASGVLRMRWGIW